MARLHSAVSVLAFGLALASISSGAPGIDGLPQLTRGRTRAEHALWAEDPLGKRFHSTKHVVVAEMKEPAVIAMIHFAMPQALDLNRDVLLKAYWDGETSPGVDCALIDFLCDPSGWTNRLFLCCRYSQFGLTRMRGARLMIGELK